MSQAFPEARLSTVCGAAYTDVVGKALSELTLVAGLLCISFRCGSRWLAWDMQRKLLVFWIIYGGGTAILEHYSNAGGRHAAWLQGPWPQPLHMALWTILA